MYSKNDYPLFIGVYNHSKRPSGLPFSIKARIKVLRYNVIHEKGKRVSAGSYFNRVQNLLTLIEKRQNMDSKKVIGWLFSLKVGSRFEFVVLLKLGHLDTVMTQSQCRLCQGYSDSPTNKLLSHNQKLPLYFSQQKLVLRNNSTNTAQQLRLLIRGQDQDCFQVGILYV